MNSSATTARFARVWPARPASAPDATDTENSKLVFHNDDDEGLELIDAKNSQLVFRRRRLLDADDSEMGSSRPISDEEERMWRSEAECGLARAAVHDRRTTSKACKHSLPGFA